MPEVPSVAGNYARLSPAVDTGRISGKFLAQSSTRLAGRIGWHVALLGRRAGPETASLRMPGVARFGPVQCPAVRGFGPGKGPGRLSRQRRPCSWPTGRLRTEGACPGPLPLTKPDREGEDR